MVNKDQLCAIALMKRRNIFLRFYLKWLLSETSHTHLRLIIQSIDSIDASSFCPLIKQDLTFKQAHPASFCFVLRTELKLYYVFKNIAFSMNVVILQPIEPP